MHPQLAAIVDDFEAASNRLHRLETNHTSEEWLRRPAAGSWSAAECVAHLNLTGAAYVPLLKDALSRARDLGGGAPARFRRDLLGWFIWRSTRPEAKMRVKTTAGFVPGAADDRAALVAEFDRLQAEQIAILREADGLPIHRVKMKSPFAERVRYSLYSGFTVLPTHQLRHLAQAERALNRGAVDS